MGDPAVWANYKTDSERDEMRKPSYSVAHERENQRRRVLEEEEERERERIRLRKAIAEEKEEERKTKEYMKYVNDLYASPRYPEPQQQPKQVESNESLMMKMIKQIVDGPPPTIRIMARFGQSNYDITITKVEELEAVQAIINKFINAHQNPNNF
jgi:hypothetical protein